MAIPDFQSILLPLLKHAGDKEEHSLRDAREKIAESFALTPDDKAQLLPSGRQPLFANRVAWAKTYLERAGLLKAVRRGYFQITDRGIQVLGEALTRIDMRFLNRYPEFVKFHTVSKAEIVPPIDEGEGRTPEEALEVAYGGLREKLIVEILERLTESAPDFFERLVVELLVAMGYWRVERRSW